MTSFIRRSKILWVVMPYVESMKIRRNLSLPSSWLNCEPIKKAAYQAANLVALEVGCDVFLRNIGFYPNDKAFTATVAVFSTDALMGASDKKKLLSCAEEDVGRQNIKRER
jgi:hypothetical protein